MTTGDQYRSKAIGFEERARHADAAVAQEWRKIAAAYFRLAVLADSNDRGGLLIEIMESLPPSNQHS